METVLRDFNLGPTQWYVLYHLANNGPMTQRDLTTVLRVERSTLSDVLASLVRKGLVDQVPDEADQRRRVLRLTPGGESLWDSLPDPIAMISAIAFDDADPNDLATAIKVLQAATHRLNEHSWEGHT